MKLSDLKTGECGKIFGFEMSVEDAERLEAMGIYKGGTVAALRVAPYSNSLIVSVSGKLFAVRKKTADGILVKKDETAN